VINTILCWIASKGTKTPSFKHQLINENIRYMEAIKMPMANQGDCMISISLAMIVKNEEKTIERCLNSVAHIMDEIIIVDTGSTDKTKELCKKYTDKVYDFEWIDDFSAARNYSYSLATKDYIMWLDADDILLPEEAEKLQELKASLSKDIDIVMMKYATGVDINGNISFSYYRERLSKREKDYLWKEPVHEYLNSFGKIYNSDITIIHAKPYEVKRDTDRNIRIYENLIRQGIPLSARGQYYYARELKDHGRYEEAIEWFVRFLDSGKGWVEDNINACNELGKCYLLINKPGEALKTFYRSFLYNLPRAEICCQIAYYYQSIKDYKKAAFWFEFALTLPKPEGSWGFYQPDFWDYIPLIECAVCYDHLGEYEKAAEYNNRALSVRPDSLAALRNQEYFKNKLKQT